MDYPMGQPINGLTTSGGGDPAPSRGDAAQRGVAWPFQQRRNGIPWDLFVSYGSFHSHGATPIAGWFIRENPVKVDDN